MCRDDYYYRMLEDFKFYFPATEAKMVSWYPSGKYELTIFLNDYSKVRYNGRSQTIRSASSDPDTDISTNISKRLKQRMDECRMTQKELAEKIGISSQTLGRYISGDRTPSVLIANHISRALECSLSELFEDY